MSVVMKPETDNLPVLFVAHEQMPDDFYTNTAKYEAELDAAINTARNLVHPFTEEGRKLAKSDASLIRKYAKANGAFSLSVFRSLTDKVKIWRDGITDKTRQLEDEADNIMARFEKIEQEKLDLAHDLMVNHYAFYREKLGLRPEFYGVQDLSPMIKLSSVTDSIRLSAKARQYVEDIADDNLRTQQTYDMRILVLANRCLLADINPPLTQVHLGTVFYADEEVFNAKVGELINTEIGRRAEMEARIIKQQTTENQRKIELALKDQQDENDRIARGQAMGEPKPVTTMQQVDNAIAQEAKRKDDIKHPPVTGNLRTVIITATFEFKDINDNTSNGGVEKFFRGKLPELMLAKLSKVSCANA